MTRFNYTEMVADTEQTPIRRDVCRSVKPLHLWIKAALFAQGMYHSNEKGTKHRGKHYQLQSRDSNQAPTRSWCITNQIQWTFHLVIHEWIHKFHIALHEANSNILAAMQGEIDQMKVIYLQLYETYIYSNCYNFRDCFDNIFLVANTVLEIWKYIDWISSPS